ncbi:PaaI family thioesterase [Sulfobacillus thermosulfidooxidans]|uniref:PaaI family thioesterase n=1 Tax=Sulfobacillus thermosulfidooxidans TaxID=28034 RepID=UPI0004011760|nr:PaaI family thioesterase [Sulfobacillus thermosulfidooxidans]
MDEWQNNPCFICGNQNDQGMHVHFTYLPQEHLVQAEVVVTESWQGFKGIVHGGIIAGLLDDAMWHILWNETHVVSMTADLRVRYRKPLYINTPLLVIGKLVESTRRLMRAQAFIEQNQEVMASSEGIFLPAKGLHE